MALNMASLVRNDETKAAETRKRPLRRVECDAMALLKIVKACREKYPTPVNGQLLGMDVGSKDCLEVTDCLTVINRHDLLAQLTRDRVDPKEIESRIRSELKRYGSQVVELMRMVNSDCLTVGWYQTISFDTFINVDVIDTLCDYQESVEKAVVLGFDPLLSLQGLKAFKAYQVSPVFLKLHSQVKTESPAAYKKLLRGKKIFEELPIVVKNPLLVEAFLLEWTDSCPHLFNSFFYENFEAERSNYLKKSVNFMSDCLDELHNEQEKLMRHLRDHQRQQTMQKQFIERRRQENEQRKLRNEEELPADSNPIIRRVEQPNQISTILMSSHMETICQDITRSVSENLAKTLLLNKSER